MDYIHGPQRDLTWGSILTLETAVVRELVLRLFMFLLFSLLSPNVKLQNYHKFPKSLISKSMNDVKMHDVSDSMFRFMLSHTSFIILAYFIQMVFSHKNVDNKMQR